MLIGLQRKAISLGAQYISGKVTGFSEETMDDVILEGTQQSNIKRITAAEVRLSVTDMLLLISFIRVIFNNQELWCVRIQDMELRGNVYGIMKHLRHKEFSKGVFVL